MYIIILERAQPVRRNEYVLFVDFINFDPPNRCKMKFFPIYNKYERYAFFLGFCEPREKQKRRWPGDSSACYE